MTDAMPTIRVGLLTAALVAALIRSTDAMTAEPASRMGSFRLDAPCARAFPLFTPLGERTWAQGWNPELLSGSEERGSVFRTRSHDTETLWIVADYRPAQGRVSYARLKQGSNFGLVDVECRDVAGGSEITVRYTLTGISAEGDAFVRDFLAEEAYASFIDEWQRTIDAVLKEGGGS